MVKKAMRVGSLLLCSILLSNSLIVAEGSFLDLLRNGDQGGILRMLAYTKMDDVLDRVEALRSSTDLVTVQDLVSYGELSEEFGAAVEVLYNTSTVEESVAAAREVRRLLDAERADEDSWSEGKRDVLERLDYVLRVVESGLLTAPGIVRTLKNAASNLWGKAVAHKLVSIPLAIAAVMAVIPLVNAYTLRRARNYNIGRDTGSQGGAFWDKVPTGKQMYESTAPGRSEEYTARTAARRKTKYRNNHAEGLVAARENGLTEVTGAVGHMQDLLTGLKRGIGRRGERARAIDAGTALEEGLGREREEAVRIATARVDRLIYRPDADHVSDGSDGEEEDADGYGGVSFVSSSAADSSALSGGDGRGKGRATGPKTGWLARVPNIDDMQRFNSYAEVGGLRRNVSRDGAAEIFAGHQGLEVKQACCLYTFVKRGDLESAVELVLEIDPSLDRGDVVRDLRVKLQRRGGRDMVYLDDSGGEEEVSGGRARAAFDVAGFLRAVPRPDHVDLAAMGDGTSDKARDSWAARVAGEHGVRPVLSQKLFKYMRRGPTSWTKARALLIAPRKRLGGGFGMEAGAAEAWLDANLGKAAAAQQDLDDRGSDGETEGK